MAGVFLVVAESPNRILTDEALVMSQDLTPVVIPPAPEKAELPLPEPPPADLAAAKALAPEPMNSSSLVDLGFGTAYGAGGSGPAIAGGGGLGTDQAQLVRDGGVADRPPRLLSRGPLEYPPEARAKGVRGFVVVKVFIANSGSVEKVEVSEAEPKGVFEAAVIRSVQGWRFEPGITQGQTASMWTSQRVRFDLE